MAGINDSTLVHGVIDLIEQKLKSHPTGNEWEGTPSVVLYREHPLDDWVLTSARLLFPSGYETSIILNRGMTQEEIDKAIANNMKTGYLPPVFDSSDPTSEELDPFNYLTPEEQDPDASVPTVNGGSHGSYIIEPTVPLDINKDHYDYDFYLNWRLKNVIIEKTDKSGVLIESLTMHMVYDHESRLVASLVENETNS